MDLKKIAIFGCGNNACELVRTLERYKIYPSIYVDSDTCKQGTYFLDRFLIDSPECLKSIRDYFVVILYLWFFLFIVIKCLLLLRTMN